MWQTMCENTVALSVQKWSTTVLITLLHMWHIVGMPGHFTLDTLSQLVSMHSLSHNLSQCTHSLTTCLNALTLSQGEMKDCRRTGVISVHYPNVLCTHTLDATLH